MTREELIAAARRACAAWWSSFGRSADPDREWENIDDEDRDYWCFVADAVLSLPAESERAGVGT